MKNLASALVVALLLPTVSCSMKSGDDSGGKPTIQNKGSDTMLEVAQNWSEAYEAADIEVSGGGSGNGITALIDGNVDIANASRSIKASEIQRYKDKNPGRPEPVEVIAGYDALAVYVHKDNPIESISLSQLKQLFGDGGSASNWSDLGISIPGCEGKIVLAGRQSSSGTYEYFREAVLGKKGKYKLSTNEQNGSRALVTFVAQTPCAIGYSGMGYKTDEVKLIPVKSDDAGAAVSPSVDTVQDGSYPIARPLFIYYVPDKGAHLNEFAKWILEPEAQKIVGSVGYVPVKK